jgi:hypothetical protein
MGKFNLRLCTAYRPVYVYMYVVDGDDALTVVYFIDVACYRDVCYTSLSESGDNFHDGIM